MTFAFKLVFVILLELCFFVEFDLGKSLDTVVTKVDYERVEHPCYLLEETSVTQYECFSCKGQALVKGQTETSSG